MDSDTTSVSIFDRIDESISGFMRRYGFRVLRFAVAIVFVWFGALKFFPGLSPAAQLVTDTVTWIPPKIFLPVLAAWEVLIGICLLHRKLLRLAIFLLFAQMGGTFLPLINLPHETWLHFPYAPTLEGQYIIKNLVIIGAALVIGSTVREESHEHRKL